MIINTLSSAELFQKAVKVKTIMLGFFTHFRCVLLKRGIVIIYIRQCHNNRSNDDKVTKNIVGKCTCRAQTTRETETETNRQKETIKIYVSRYRCK